MAEADAGAGEDEESANPERRRLGAFRRLVEGGIFYNELEDEQEDGSQAESDQRRNQQDLKDTGGLFPIHSAGAGVGIHELIGDADADDGADEGVGAGGGQSEPPGAEVPEDGSNEESEDHGEASAPADLQDQFNREQRNDGESDSA